MNIIPFTIESTQDKIDAASILEHTLILLINQIKKDQLAEEQLEKLFDIERRTIQKWTGPARPMKEMQGYIPIVIPKTISPISLNDFISGIYPEAINIGFDNYYPFDQIDCVSIKTPMNTLLYDRQTHHIIIKVGSMNKYKVINTRLCNVYAAKSTDNSRSIICNNNLLSKGLRCYNSACKYYHDPYLGYKDNAHPARQYSNCPIVYSKPDFKSGSTISQNAKKVNWPEAITLYQSSLNNILIACIHARMSS
jgi:hypothetical protein